MNKVILYIATSLDGFIADKEGGVDWLPHETEDPKDLVGFKALLNRISVIVMGSKSYKQILTFGQWAWPDKQTYVFTSQNLKTRSNLIPSPKLVGITVITTSSINFSMAKDLISSAPPRSQISPF